MECGGRDAAGFFAVRRGKCEPTALDGSQSGVGVPVGLCHRTPNGTVPYGDVGSPAQEMMATKGRAKR